MSIKFSIRNIFLISGGFVLFLLLKWLITIIFFIVFIWLGFIFSQFHDVRPEQTYSLVNFAFHFDFFSPELLLAHDFAVNCLCRSGVSLNQGCDASVFLDDSNGNESHPIERQAIPSQTLKGFDKINLIKEELEEACPGMVSCADALALATRDGILLVRFNSQLLLCVCSPSSPPPPPLPLFSSSNWGGGGGEGKKNTT